MRWLIAALAAGLVMRLCFAFAQAGMYFPDETFQYLEPAWHHAHGYGTLMWEWELGLRNWVLPSLNGGLMLIGEALGLRGCGLQRFLWVHNALVSLAMIPAGFRLGAAIGDARLARLVGCAFAVWPLFGYLAPHTLSDNHAMLCVTWAYVLWLEGRRSFVVGLLLAAAFTLRYSMMAFFPVLFLGELRNQRRLLGIGGGLAAGLAGLALVDWVTWGTPLHSFVQFWLHPGPAQFWDVPFWYYIKYSAFVHQGAGMLLLLAGALVVARRSWRPVAAWLVPLLIFSCLSHKEDRYVLAVWPFFLASGLAGLLQLGDRFGRKLLAPALALVWLLAAAATVRMPMRLAAGIFRAQTDVGAREDATGLLVDGRSWFSPGGNPWLTGEVTPWWHGGHFMTGKNIPVNELRDELLAHSLFNYVIVGDAGNILRLSGLPEFEIVQRYEAGVTLFRRHHP